MPVDFDALVNAPVIEAIFDHPRPITFYPVASDPERVPFAVKGIWDREHEIIFAEVAHSETHAAGTSTTMPVLTVRLASFAKRPRQGDRFEIDGETFEVWDVRPDGAGAADLIAKIWHEAEASC